jgi:nucleoid-associated protein YgaU
MGLFDFVKDAGKVLDDSMDVAKNLKAELSEQGLQVERLEIQAKDGVVTIGGKVKSQSDREKVILALGNVKGIGSVNDQLEVATVEPEAVFYTVKSGDTLSKISKTHYGNAMKYMKIFEANQTLLKNPDKIYPGQVLRIPPLKDK